MRRTSLIRWLFSLLALLSPRRGRKEEKAKDEEGRERSVREMSGEGLKPSTPDYAFGRRGRRRNACVPSRSENQGTLIRGDDARHGPQ